MSCCEWVSQHNNNTYRERESTIPQNKGKPTHGRDSPQKDDTQCQLDTRRSPSLLFFSLIPVVSRSFVFLGGLFTCTERGDQRRLIFMQNTSK